MNKEMSLNVQKSVESYIEKIKNDMYDKIIKSNKAKITIDKDFHPQQNEIIKMILTNFFGLKYQIIEYSYTWEIFIFNDLSLYKCKEQFKNFENEHENKSLPTDVENIEDIV